MSGRWLKWWGEWARGVFNNFAFENKERLSYLGRDVREVSWTELWMVRGGGRKANVRG